MELEEHIAKSLRAYKDPVIVKMMYNENVISICTTSIVGKYLLEIEVVNKYDFNENIVLSTGETIQVKYV